MRLDCKTETANLCLLGFQVSIPSEKKVLKLTKRHSLLVKGASLISTQQALLKNCKGKLLAERVNFYVKVGPDIICSRRRKKTERHRTVTLLRANIQIC